MKFSACVAPFNNIYFAVKGQASPCWLSSGHLDKWSKNKSIKDIWIGENFQRYRDNLRLDIFEDKCKICKEDIDKGRWPLAKAYEKFSVDFEYPTLMELELSNVCNLECLMCSGNLSSGIRKNREKLPPLEIPYDDTFVEQLNEFIPHLEELRFNGGEPLLQDIVHKICHNVARINPKLKINIATNGTVFNKKVNKLLEECNIHLNISIDGFTQEVYEKIRVNASYFTLMKNFERFHAYCKRGNRELSVMVNPMRNNWWQMHEFVKFTHDYNVNLWYNTIRYPEHLALWNWKENLEEVYNKMKYYLNSMPPYRDKNKYEHLVNKQIKSWYEAI